VLKLPVEFLVASSKRQRDRLCVQYRLHGRQRGAVHGLRRRQV
jgi:hypothetical protein